jgi:PKD repeat protein
MVRRWSLACVLALLVGMWPAAVGASTPPLPDSIAAVGDSITQAASSGGSLGTDYPQNSWSTGTASGLGSHYQRLAALNAAITGHATNGSVSGAKMADLNGQMQLVAAQHPGYLTVLIGGNDLCTDTVAQMTPVDQFGAQFGQAMDTLTAASPATYVYVVSIPDAYQLWALFKNNWWARFVWSVGGICQSLLANPTSTQSADVQRRATVRQRNIDYNARLAQVCATHARCLFDGNAVFNTQFTTSDVSGDYFHPSLSGQAKLAAVSWSAGYWANGGPPPANQPPVAGFSWSCTDLSCSFTDASTDDGTLVGWAWDFGDGSGSALRNPVHAFTSGGTYDVTLTVTDDVGATDAVMHPVTVSAPPPSSTISVANLTGSSVATGKRTWAATATATILAGGGAAVSGATVTISWSTGALTSCVTGAAGTCSVSSGNLNSRKVGSTTATVTDVTAPGATWDQVVQSITINR